MNAAALGGWQVSGTLDRAKWNALQRTDELRGTSTPRAITAARIGLRAVSPAWSSINASGSRIPAAFVIPSTSARVWGSPEATSCVSLAQRSSISRCLTIVSLGIGGSRPASQIRTEFFNALNHTNLGAPVNSASIHRAFGTISHFAGPGP